MIPKIHGSRSSIGPTLRYFEREKTPGQGRVADHGFVELPPGITLETAGQIMSATAREQATIKALRGVSARGRPSRDIFYAFSLSWHPDEDPTRPVIEKAVEGALESVGLAGHQAVWVLHADTEHRHVHVAALRVSWETGRTVRMSHDKKKLSAWALAYEKAQGKVRVETRVQRKAWRATARDLHRDRDTARVVGDTIALGRLQRQVAEHAQAWPRSEPSRGPGREARSDEDRQEWAQTYACQRAQPDADPDILLRERVRLSRRQGRRRRLKRRLAQVGAVASQVGDTASRVGRVAKDVAGVAGAGVIIGAVELVGGASRATRVGKELVNVAGHEIVCGASRAARVGKSVAILAGVVTLAGTGKLASGGVLLVSKVLEQRDRAAAKAAAEAEAREQEEAMELRNARASRPFYGKCLEQAPVGLLADLRRLVKGRAARARPTPATRTPEASQAGSVSDRVSDAVPAAARSTRAEPAAAPSTRARTDPEPPPTRPGSAREAAGVKRTNDGRAVHPR